jgi:hypothetical protein
MKIRVVGKWLVGIVSAIIAGTAIALALVSGGPAAVQSNAAYDYVKKVHAGSDNHLRVAVPGNFSSAHGCSTPYWAVSRNTFDDPQTQAMLQISLSSLLTRMQVHVYTDGCDASGYPILTQIQIQEREPTPTPTPTPTPQPGCVVPAGGRCCGNLVNGLCQGQCVGPNQSCQ